MGTTIRLYSDIAARHHTTLAMAPPSDTAGEVYSPAHLTPLPCTTMTPPNPFGQFSLLVTELVELVKNLPTSVRSAKSNSRIVTVFTNIPVPDNPIDQWEAFDKRMNALYGEDLRDAGTKRLPNIQRGKHGLDLVVTYIQDMIKKSSLDWIAAMPKVQRLVDELKVVK